ncbi:MAG: hybrid sensor histidine kinase/response regulator [Nannocystales bacterium]
MSSRPAQRIGVRRADRYLAVAFGTVIVFLMAAVLLLGETFSDRLNKRYDEALEAATLSMLSSAVAKVGDSGKFHERALVEELVESSETIDYVIVSDANGRIRSHSDPRRNGTTLQNAQRRAVARALASSEPVFDTLETEHGPVRQISAAYSAGFNRETPGVIILGLPRATAEIERRNMRWLLGGVVIALTLLAAISALVISRIYGRNMRRMAEQLDGILTHTPLLIRVDNHRGDVVLSSAAYTKATCEDEHLADAMRASDAEPDGDWESGEGNRYSLTSFAIERIGSNPVQTCTVGLDITKQSRAEQALRENEERLRITLDSIADAVIATDSATRIERMNPRAENLTQWTLSEARGKHLHDVFRTEALPEGTTAGDHSDGTDAVLRPKDGSERRIEYSSSKMAGTGETDVGDVVVFRDVTDRRRDEMRLRQADKEDSIGQLAGGVAHDFNNMLTGIMGASELIALEMTEPDESRNHDHINEYVGLIQATATRAAKLTEQLLTFSRRGSSTVVPVDVHALIAQTVDLLRSSVDKRITIRTQLTSATPIVSGDPTRIQMALLNLGVNARDAMGESGTLSIETECVVLSAAQSNELGDPVSPGPYVRIAFRDTGCGMTATQLDKIFEPYFTTKELGKGTGLGLASVQGAIRSTRGAIAVETELDVGTTFTVFLPRVEEAEQHRATDGMLRDDGQPGATILVVEDEELVRLTAVRFLESLGYQVLEARDGREAVETFEANAESIDIVITDMLMPVMNGREAFYAIRAIRPEVPVVAVSGYTRDVDVEALEADGLVGFLRKPYKHEELATLVARSLDTATKNSTRSAQKPD